ncbi:43350_t:CDS:2, partial [Gigaspora margarita]
AESGFIDYGIEKMEEQRKTQTEQMIIDTEFYKENPFKTKTSKRKEDNKSSIKVKTNIVQSKIRLGKKFDLRDKNITRKEKNLSQLESSLNNSKGKVRKNLIL